MKIKEGSIAHIKAKNDATKRTKSRIREHGEAGFLLERRADNISPPLWLVRSDSWYGWLPAKEFVVEEKK